jgi:hypothetical protein
MIWELLHSKKITVHIYEMSEIKQNKLHDMKGFEKERNPLYEKDCKGLSSCESNRT